MAQQLIKVPPTKNTLLNLKKQTKFLEQGHDLLERKRELLTRLVYERIGEYRRLRDEAEKALEDGYRCLSISHLRMGSRGSGDWLCLQIPRRMSSTRLFLGSVHLSRKKVRFL